MQRNAIPDAVVSALQRKRYGAPRRYFNAFGTAHVFGRNAAGDLIQYYWSPQPSWAAENLTQRANIGNAFKIAGDPAADSFLSGDIPTEHVFARNAVGDLIQYYWSPQPSWAAENLTQRANIGNAFQIASDPAAVSYMSGDTPTEHVFGRNAAGELIHYYWIPQTSWAAENLTASIFRNSVYIAVATLDSSGNIADATQYLAGGLSEKVKMDNYNPAVD